jgi:hypothetical protein
MQLVTVARVFSPAEAHLVSSRLEAAGFPVHVAHELAAMGMEGYSMSTGGILVQVPDDRAAEAQEFLKSTGPSSQ